MFPYRLSCLAPVSIWNSPYLRSSLSWLPCPLPCLFSLAPSASAAPAFTCCRAHRRLVLVWWCAISPYSLVIIATSLGIFRSSPSTYRLIFFSLSFAVVGVPPPDYLVVPRGPVKLEPALITQVDELNKRSAMGRGNTGDRNGSGYRIQVN